MHKRSVFHALAAGLLVCSFGTIDAGAGMVLVYQDAGTFNFTLTADGLGDFSISYSNAQLTTINNAAISTGNIQATLPALAMHTVTSTITSGAATYYTLTQPSPSEKFFGTGAGAIDTSEMLYELTSGVAIDPSFLNLSGHILGVPATLLETTATAPTIYDLSPYLNGGDITRTYTDVGVNFATIIANGGTITGSGAFSDLAGVPEPASMALLGIGMMGIIVFRRFFMLSPRAV